MAFNSSSSRVDPLAQGLNEVVRSLVSINSSLINSANYNQKITGLLGEILTVFAIKQHCKQNDHAFDNQLIIG